MIVNIKITSRFSQKTKDDDVKTVSTSYATTLPLDFQREDAIAIFESIIDQVFPERFGQASSRAGRRIAVFDGITECFAQDRYSFSISGNIPFIEEKDVDVDF
ncbi:MAG TPA: hypothetical protein PLS84_09680 [Salinivirgaceae bacterium]|nr:hypothetical protein [Salinivirgaceae bacterium]